MFSVLIVAQGSTALALFNESAAVHSVDMDTRLFSGSRQENSGHFEGDICR